MTLELRSRALRLAGVAVIVAAALVVLYAAGILGRQGGGAGIENAKTLDTPPVPSQPDLSVSAEPGKLAPDFEVSDISGQRYRLSDFRGKVIYLNFWATWCVPCQVEMPDMYELLEREDNLVIIAVNRGESLDRAKRFLENLSRNDGGTGVSFSVDGMDPDDTLYEKYRGLGMPVSVFIDRNGVITRVRNGLLRLSQMEEALARAELSQPD